MAFTAKMLGFPQGYTTKCWRCLVVSRSLILRLQWLFSVSFYVISLCFIYVMIPLFFPMCLQSCRCTNQLGLLALTLQWSQPHWEIFGTPCTLGGEVMPLETPPSWPLLARAHPALTLSLQGSHQELMLRWQSTTVIFIQMLQEAHRTMSFSTLSLCLHLLWTWIWI